MSHPLHLVADFAASRTLCAAQVRDLAPLPSIPTTAVLHRYPAERCAACFEAAGLGWMVDSAAEFHVRDSHYGPTVCGRRGFELMYVLPAWAAFPAGLGKGPWAWCPACLEAVGAPAAETWDQLALFGGVA